MQKLSKTAIIIVSIVLITSCISPEKLAKVQEEGNACKRQVNELEAKNLDLVKINDSLVRQYAAAQKVSNNELDQKQMLLDQNIRQLEKNQKLMNDLQKEAKLEQDEMNSIHDEISKVLRTFSPDEISVKMRDGELYVSMSDRLLFPTGSDVINERGKKALKMLSNALKRTSMKIIVEGNTDAVPINNKLFKDNWDLSVYRATSVVRVLTESGINPTRIIASGRSEFHPIASNKSESGRRYNRRTEIALLPRLDKLKALLSHNFTAQTSSQVNKTAMK
jgi:chemotaxis protein MotB